MTPFVQPVERLSDAEFDALVAWIEDGLRSDRVGLQVEEGYGYRELAVYSAAGLEDLGVDVEVAESAVKHLDQLMVFAFDNAPDEVVTSWAEDVDQSPDVALSRVVHMRMNMPVLRALWDAKSASVLPIVTGVRVEIVQASDSSGLLPHGNLYLSAGRTSVSGHRIIASSVERLQVRLWPDDVTRIQAQLDALRVGLRDAGKEEAS